MDEIEILVFFFVLLRVSSLLIFLPFFGENTIPFQVKILLSILIAAVFVPFAANWDRTFILQTSKSEISIMIVALSEVLLGGAIGLFARICFGTVLTAGHFVSAQMGLSMASVFDPTIGQQSTSIQRFFYLSAMLLFLSMNGHYLYLNVIRESFERVPPGSIEISGNFIQLLVTTVNQLFIWAIKLAAPVLLLTMAVNTGMGLVSRAVPQMNVLMVAFAANILVGFIVLFACFPVFLESVSGVISSVGETLFKTLRVI